MRLAQFEEDLLYSLYHWLRGLYRRIATRVRHDDERVTYYCPRSGRHYEIVLREIEPATTEPEGDKAPTPYLARPPPPHERSSR